VRGAGRGGHRAPVGLGGLHQRPGRLPRGARGRSPRGSGDPVRGTLPRRGVHRRGARVRALGGSGAECPRPRLRGRGRAPGTGGRSQRGAPHCRGLVAAGGQRRSPERSGGAGSHARPECDRGPGWGAAALPGVRDAAPAGAGPRTRSRAAPAGGGSAQGVGFAGGGQFPCPRGIRSGQGSGDAGSGATRRNRHEHRARHSGRSAPRGDAAAIHPRPAEPAGFAGAHRDLGEDRRVRQTAAAGGSPLLDARSGIPGGARATGCCSALRWGCW